MDSRSRCHSRSASSGDARAERAEPLHRIRLHARRRLDLGHVLEAREIGNAAQHRQQQPGLRHGRKRRRRVPRQQQLEQFHPHPLARQLREAGALGDAGGKPRGIGQPMAVSGMEAEEAQDAQIILGDALSRVADEAHAARFEIGKAADVIVHDAVGGHRKRVHGEVAPLGVGAPVAAEAHLGVAAEGLDVLAQAS